AVGFPDLPALLQAVAQASAELLDVRTSSIRLWTEDRKSLRVAAEYGLLSGLSVRRRDLRPGDGVAGQVGVNGIPREIQNLATEPSFQELEVFLDVGLRSGFVVALRGQTEILGTLAIFDDRVREYTPVMQQALQEFASVAALALESRQLYDRLEEANQELEARAQRSAILLGFMRLAVGFPEASALLQAVAQWATELVGARASLVRLWTEDRENLKVVAHHQLSSVAPRLLDLRPGEGVLSRAGSEGGPYEIPDLAADPNVTHQDLFLEAGLRSSLIVPLRARNESLGSLSVFDCRQRRYTPEESQALQELATVAALAIENRRLYKNLEQACEEVKATQQQLIQAERLTAVGRLVSGVAHELNNPLTSILGFVDLLHEQSQDPEQKECLGRVVRESQRAARIIRQLLRVARQEAMHQQAVSLNALVQEVLALKAYQCTVNQITITTELAPDLPETVGDPQLLTQVVLNLVTNAEQAMLGAHGRGTLALRTRRVGTELHLEVEDDGPGIPADLQDKLFLPFVTTKAVGQGTGLGLSVCLGIAEQHGGTIRLESEKGKGTRFTVIVPWRPPAETRPEGAHADGRGEV
ncbi:MAG: GAF domain-containing protein, partial [Deltaproteobacteria bacterium]|nr:GAF domain-containing protein [Deltaproteobacteria bacterium]